MSLKLVADLLAASGAVTAIAGTRIGPLKRTQDTLLPAITLIRSDVNPITGLSGSHNLDEERIQVDIWAETYAEADALARACRTAMQAATHVYQGEFDGYEPDTSPGVYRITQEYSVWI
jgi:hypothetical protein